MSNITLSSCQENAKDAFESFLLDKNQKEIVISGSAGTGKSFLVKHLAELARNEQKVTRMLDPTAKVLPIYFTATTNKATHVLQRNLGSSRMAQTIHSFLGLRVKSNYKTGKTELYRHKDATKIKPGILFIDEASMISGELWLNIRKHADNCKVVYIGDPYQLTPVKEDVSAVFSNLPNFELKTIQRQAQGSPIITLAQEFRQMMDKDTFDKWPEIIPDGHAIHTVDGPQFQKLVEYEYNQDHDPNDLRIVAWSNLKVISYNKHVRAFFTTSDDYFAGEIVATNKPIMVDDEQVVAPADSLIRIQSIEETEDEIIPGFYVNTNYSAGSFLPKNWKEANNKMKEFAKAKDWRNYFMIKNFWLDLRPIHASTVHKSQGSTYKKVFVDLDDISRNNKWKEVARLVYVALTRASDEVYFYGSLKNRY